MQSTTLSDTQSNTVVAQVVDAQGNPGTTLPGAAQVPPVSSNTGVVTVTADSTGLNLVIKAVAPGTANVAVTGTNPSGQTFSTSFGVTVTGGPGVGFTFTFG